MKNRLLISFVLILLLTTYQFKIDSNFSNFLKIEKIIVENNEVVKDKNIKENLIFLYEKNIFFLDKKKIKNQLENIDIIDSFEIKRVYPNEIVIKIYEKKPIAILQNKREKKYFTIKGDEIDFFVFKKFENLPTVFGDKENFKRFYFDLSQSNFPIHIIKNFYFFESKRWDLITKNNQTIKLPIKDYTKSLTNFLSIKDKNNFKQYKIFDYRINDQLILK